MESEKNMKTVKRMVATVAAVAASTFFAFDCSAAVNANARGGMTTVRPKATGDALINPDMGFMYYHYSNRLWAYGMNTKSGDTLDWFPGCSTIYYRLLWNDLEPEEGKYRWDIIDSTAQNWIAKGKKLCFRVICCNQTETATPQFVRDAGAKGYMFEYKTDTAPGGKMPPRWEPIYDDPVFLAKLENFIKAFAKRYDGDPSVAFVDVGSFGIYGEGHLYNTSQQWLSKPEHRAEFVRLAKLHLDMWKRLMPNTYLVVSDDIDGGWNADPDPEMMRYCREIGIGFRDDSIFCFPPKGTLKHCPFEYWAHDGWARKFAPKWPVVVETGHAPHLHGTPKWNDDAYVRCVEAYQASYMSIHDFPDVHLRDCREAIDRINRILGYRFELREATFPAQAAAGEEVEISSRWVNVGVAPRTKPTALTWSLLNADGTVAWSVTDGGFDFRSLEPRLNGVERPADVTTVCRFGFTKRIPMPDNCVTWAREKGRVFDDTVTMLKPGKYTLAVSVGSLQGTPEIALPLEGQLGSTRRYPLGTMTILPGPVQSPAAVSIPAASGSGVPLPGHPEAELSFRIIAEEFGSSNRAMKVAAPSNMKKCEVRDVGGKTVVSWRGNETFGADFEVTATLAKLPDGSLSWTFSYDNCECPIPVAEVRFPMVTVPRAQKTAILYPESIGALKWPDWSKIKPCGTVASARPQTFRFIASLTEDGPGWYVDQRDEARFHTGMFRARSGERPGTVTLEAVCEPPAASPRAWRMPFGGTIAALPGADWFAAAARYREWARLQPWYKAARSRDFGKMRDIAMWFWNRGAADHVISPVERFQEASGVPAAIDWYWWHAIPYDTGFPNFWPPREGEEAFRAAVKRCNDKGIFIQVYTNGMTWDADDPSWTEGGLESVRIKKDGTFRATAFNRFLPHRLAFMCGTAEKYQARMYPLYRNLASTGMPGIYMDMIGNASYDPCFATNHVHAPGGGTHGIMGYRDFARRIKKENPGVLLSTEDATEPYLDVFDAGICLACNYERFGSNNDSRYAVPVCQAIYHGCEVLFGSYAMVHGIPPFDPKWPTDRKWKEEKDWKALFPDQFALELTRGVTWGMQPMVHNFRPGDDTDPRFADDYRLMIDTARFYHANRCYLFDGDMCAPGKMECERQKIDFLVRGTYAREGEYRTITRETIPSVLHSVWRAPDGRVAAVFVNWTREARKFKLSAPDISVAGDIPPRSWKLVQAQK